jgi:putative colanic acid biosynthesis acetyltransferase WcaF
VTEVSACKSSAIISKMPPITNLNPSTRTSRWMSLADYRNQGYAAGRSAVIQALWYFASLVFFESGWVPLSSMKRWLLRRFGAKIGKRVVIKPHVRIKYPWRLEVGDHSWIGEEVWIDNLADVRIGENVCISQGSYLCTGSHDCHRATFDLIVAPIEIGDEVWMAARAMLLPGAVIAPGVVVAAGSLVTASLPRVPGVMVGGVPACILGPRTEVGASPREPLDPPSQKPGVCNAGALSPADDLFRLSHDNSRFSG